MVFSGGGAEDPLVRIGKDDESIALGWQGALPEPELDGATALYRDVLAGVDLKVTAGDNAAVTVDSPVTLAQSTAYRMAVFTRSYYNSGANLIESSSTVTTKGWCYFSIDSTRPKPPTVTTPAGAVYAICPSDGDGCGAATGGPGTAGQFTFTKNSADASVVAFVSGRPGATGMPPDHVDLQTPWLRTQLIDWLVRLSDGERREENWTSAGDSVLDQMLDFFDDTGVLDDPTGRVGFVLRGEAEVSAMQNLNSALDRAITSPVRNDREIVRSKSWEAVVAAAGEALSVLEAEE
ncbi:SCO4402 family protein [Streptomyces sp. SAI-126]|uniref:SCO4402 family protein n=1 Tax=Streptomyces sp. SAI-126 TaxID=3377732 RepID=UPI003C7C9F39